MDDGILCSQWDLVEIGLESVMLRVDLQLALFQPNDLYTIEVSRNYRICDFRIIFVAAASWPPSILQAASRSSGKS